MTRLSCPALAAAFLALSAAGAAAQPTSGRIQTPADALSTVLERERIFRSSAQEPRMAWNEGVGAWCVRFLVANPYSGRLEQRSYGVLSTGEVGPGEAACLPPRPPRPARPVAADGQDFVQLIGADLRARMRYPGTAREAREEGVARIAVVVHRDGRVTDVLIESSSGVPSLDVTAMELVSNLNVPVFPADIGGDRMPLMIPIRYSLLADPPPAPSQAPPARRAGPGR